MFLNKPKEIIVRTVRYGASNWARKENNGKQKGGKEMNFQTDMSENRRYIQEHLVQPKPNLVQPEFRFFLKLNLQLPKNC